MTQPTPAQINALAAAIRTADHYWDKNPDRLAEDILKHWQPPVNEGGAIMQSEFEDMIKAGFIPLSPFEKDYFVFIKVETIKSLVPKEKSTILTNGPSEEYW
jgi:hypothetical protein